MASTRWRLMTLVLAGAAVGPGGAQAASGVTFNLPAHVIIESQEHPGPNDPERCVAYAFAEFPHVRKAVGYVVTIVDSAFPQYSGPRVFPPFPDDDFSWGLARWVAPSGFHRSALSGYSTGQGCAQAILGIEGRWSISRARVSMNKRFTTQWTKPFTRCAAKRDVTYGKPVVLGNKLGDQRFIVVRRRGSVRSYPVGHPEQTQPVMTNRFTEGATVVVTDDKGIVKVGSLAGGGSVLIGPGMKVRIEAGKPIEILEYTPGVSFDGVPTAVREHIDYRVRTNGCVLGARG